MREEENKLKLFIQIWFQLENCTLPFPPAHPSLITFLMVKQPRSNSHMHVFQEAGLRMSEWTIFIFHWYVDKRKQNHRPNKRKHYDHLWRCRDHWPSKLVYFSASHFTKVLKVCLVIFILIINTGNLLKIMVGSGFSRKEGWDGRIIHKTRGG